MALGQLLVMRVCWGLLILDLVLQAQATELGRMRLASQAARFSLSGGGNSFAPVFSGNGRSVVFLSEANDLVTNDSHAPYLDIFVHDLLSGANTLVSVDNSGIGGGNDNSSQPTISFDGQIVAFVSRATNLTPNSLSNVSEVYVRDLTTGISILARTNGTGGSAGPRGSSFPLISADGRSLVFLAANANGTADVFMRDLQSGAFTLVSASSNGGNSNARSEPASISADASKVAFISNSTEILSGAGTPNFEVFVRDLAEQKTLWASANVSNYFPGSRYSCSQAVLNGSGSVAVFASTDFSSLVLFYFDLQSHELVLITDRFSDIAGPSVSTDGRSVAYSDGTNVYIWDRITTSSVLVNANSSGTGPSSGHSHSPAFSADAGKLVFLSDANDLTTEDTHGQTQVFVRDLIARTTVLASVGLDGSGIASADLDGILPAISPDGSKVAFDTADASLLSGDDNQASDIFLRDLDARTTGLISRTEPSLASLTSVGLSTVSPNCLSRNGHLLLFKSLGADLVNDVSVGRPQLFIRDLDAGSNALASASGNELGGTNITITGSEISADGRYAVFSQRYWAAGATSPAEEVFRRDLQSGSLLLVSATTNGAPSGGSSGPSMSANGQWVTFQSASPGLVTNAYGVGSNIFLRDLVGGRTILVSATPSGAPANGDSTGARLTPEGHWVVFLTHNGSLLSPRFSSFFSQVLARNVASNKTYLVSADPSANGPSFSGSSQFSISGDGRYVPFAVNGSGGSPMQFYVHDLMTQSNLALCSDCGLPSITPNGRWLVFQAPISPTATHQIIWKDMSSGVTNIASVNNAFEPSDASSAAPVITPDGRYVVFSSSARNLSDSQQRGLPNLYLRDVLQRKTLLLTSNVDGTGPGNGTAGPPLLGADGQTIIFHSFASDLVAQDFNYDRDVFLLHLTQGDSDGDGMDDDWEMANFGDLSRDGGGDFDHDGQSDLAEFLAGTDPTNGNSIFRALTVQAAGSSLTKIIWSAVPGKAYQVQYKTNLNSAAWLNLPGVVAAASSTGSALDNQAGQGPRRFYRVLLVQ